jgi:hypothetical protein
MCCMDGCTDRISGYKRLLDGWKDGRIDRQIAGWMAC